MEVAVVEEEAAAAVVARLVAGAADHVLAQRVAADEGGVVPIPLD